MVHFSLRNCVTTTAHNIEVTGSVRIYRAANDLERWQDDPGADQVRTTADCRTTSPSTGKADNNSDPRDRLSAWPPSRVLQNGQNPRGSTKGRIVECSRPDDKMQSCFIHRLQEESIYDLLGSVLTDILLLKYHNLVTIGNL